MIDSLVQQSLSILEDDFYSKKFYFSYSSLNKLLWNPVVFQQLYIAGIKEEKIESHLVNGKLIHVLLLEPEEFDNQFIISLDNLPTGSLRILLDILFKNYYNSSTQELKEYETEILKVMAQINYYQSLKTDKQRLEKIITEESKNYWDFLKRKNNKIIVDQTTYAFCKNAVDIVKLNSKVCGLIGCNTTEFDNKEVFNELPLKIDIENLPFGLKGIIDNLVIDHDKKIIFINDIKTTSKELKDFKETVEFYSYWLQASIYIQLVNGVYSDLLDQGYGITFHFITIDSSYQSYAFPLSAETVYNWQNRLNDSLNKALWHYEKKSFDLPYDFAIDSVIL
jgi:hypothetical protein